MQSVVEDVRDVVVSTLRLDGRAGALRADTPLLGHLPELDSLALLELVAALEKRFEIRIEDDEVGGELFATLTTLAEFVERKRASVA